MKKTLMFWSISLVLLVGTIFVYYLFNSEEAQVKKYVKEAYDLDVVIKTMSSSGIASDHVYTVYPTGHRHLEFEVSFDPSTSTMTDNYARAAEADEELHKLEKVIPAINELGFQGSEWDDNEIRVAFLDSMKKNSIHLYTSTPIEYETFEEKELSRIFKLQELIKESGASLKYATVEDTREVPESNSIVIQMEDMAEVQTEDELLAQLKRSNWGLASFYENQKWAAEKEKVENERFTFGSQYDDYWFNCRKVNENGDCTNILVSIYFTENNLTQSNVYLEKDLNSIFSLFEDTISPNGSIEYAFNGEGSNNGLRLTKQEIKKFGSTSDFIHANFK
ncbi:hypothetical protein [Ureibacillus aquaedulcis]|uniref:DUF4825 domain-containing protein n=1 Tax=Ureibacillus aquaedulcis TaxID=3058421 RepID=A0ABT8GL70_9BACL|nr:hypothetical protein [Ureibacillus sp. BA0131]MDN4492163.1 hypothetical protein [Ureibacillus sp. BA0131]